uniref:Uncharacterized protein n=1 Tax=Physcomitrium patens TaxID=3218 RepID=A0A2K1JPS3_PHYPA|nr:hypothetical protein PHYPA_015926 [Physcomitrium patens]
MLRFGHLLDANLIKHFGWGDVTNEAVVSSKRRYYSHALSPVLHAMKKNINHMSDLSLELQVSQFVLNIIAFYLIAFIK